MCCGLKNLCIIITALGLIGNITELSQSVSALASEKGDSKVLIPKIVSSAIALIIYGISFYGTLKQKEKLILPALIYIPIRSIVLIFGLSNVFYIGVNNQNAFLLDSAHKSVQSFSCLGGTQNDRISCCETPYSAKLKIHFIEVPLEYLGTLAVSMLSHMLLCIHENVP